MQRFLPLFSQAGCAHKYQVGEKWRGDATNCQLKGKSRYLCCAIGQDGQVLDVYFSERRNLEVAESFFKRAIDETGVRPLCVTTYKARCYPPVLPAVHLDANIGTPSTSTMG